MNFLFPIRHHSPFPFQMKWGIARLVLVLLSMSVVFSVQGVYADHRQPNITFIIAPADPIRHGIDASGFMFNDNGEILMRPPFGGPSGELQIVDLSGNGVRVSGRDAGGDFPQWINEEGKVMYFCKADTVCIASPPDYKEKIVISGLEELPDHVITALGGRLDRGKARLTHINAIDLSRGNTVYFLASFSGPAFYDAPEISEGCRDRITGALNCGGDRYALLKKVGNQYPGDAVIAARSQLPFVKIVTSPSGATSDVSSLIVTGGIGSLVANDAGQIAISFRQSENKPNDYNLVLFPSGSLITLPGGISNSGHFKMNNNGEILALSSYDGRLYVVKEGGIQNPVTPPAYIRDSRGFVVRYLFRVAAEVYDINDVGTVVVAAFDTANNEGGLYVALPENETYGLDRLIRPKGQFELYKDPRGIYNVARIGPIKFLGAGPIDINNKGQVAFFSREFHDLTKGENRYSGFFVLDLDSDKKIDLSIKSINPVQVVQTTDNRIPLVKDKSTMVRVFVELKEPKELEDVTMEVDSSGIKQSLTRSLVKFDDKTYVLDKEQFKEYTSNRDGFFKRDPLLERSPAEQLLFRDGIDAYNFWADGKSVIIPKASGRYTIKAKIILSDGSILGEKSTSITAKEWKKDGFKILFSPAVPVPDFFKKSPTGPQYEFVLLTDQDDLVDAMRNHAKALNAAFPFPRRRFLDPTYQWKDAPDHYIRIDPEKFNNEDLRFGEMIYTLSDVTYYTGYDRGVWVLPKEAMKALGLASPVYPKAVLVREDADAFTTAHEIAHTYQRSPKAGDPPIYSEAKNRNGEPLFLNALCDEYETKNNQADCDSDDKNDLSNIDWNEEQYPNGWTICSELGYPNGRSDVDCFGWDPDGYSRRLFGQYYQRSHPKINVRPNDFRSHLNHYSFMSAGNSKKNPWITLRNYKILMELPDKILPDPNVLLVSGVISGDGRFHLFPLSVIEGTASEMIPGEYSFELKNANDETISQTSFLPYFVVNPFDTMEERIVAPFAFAIEYPEGVSKIVFKKNEVILQEIVVSTHVPQIGINSIHEIGNNKIRVDWSANDSDGEKLFYSINYSHNGKDFIPLYFRSADVPFNFTFDTIQLPGSQQAVVEINATDGINTARIRSQAFRVPTKAPLTEFTSPRFGDRFMINQEIPLLGEAYDPEDRSLFDDSLVWASSIDEHVGIGEDVFVNLTKGIHKITLTATDSEEKTGTDYTIILVGEEKTLGNLIKAVELLEINRGIQNSLLVKLRAAERNVEKGRIEAARNEIEAFVNEVEAQRGKELRDDFANGLIEWARNLKF